MIENRTFSWRYLAAWCAGGLTTLTYAPFHLWFLAPLPFIVPLLLSQQESFKRAAFIWFSYGFGKFAIGIHWIHVSMTKYGGLDLPIAMLLMAILSAYLALYPMLAGALLHRLNPSHQLSITLLLFPALWCVTEWLKSIVLTGFPWLMEGYAFVDSPFMPLASSIGALGMTWIITTLSVCLLLWFKKDIQPTFIPLSIFLALFSLQLIYQPIQKTDKHARISLVQSNIEQSLKWQPGIIRTSLQKQTQLSEPLFKTSDIIVWPEAAITEPEQHPITGQYLTLLNIMASKGNSALITGIIEREYRNFYNSIIVLGDYQTQSVSKYGDYTGHNENRYRKHHLLPIGEFVPLEDFVRPIAPFFNLPMSNFQRGADNQSPLQAKGFLLLPALCYEIIFSEELRKNFSSDIDFLITLSNDTWFGKSIGPAQHLQIAQMRAAELGRPLIRDTNDGITAFVDHKGKIIKKAPQFETAVLTENIDLVQGETLYSRVGHWPTVILSLMIVIGFSVRCWKTRFKNPNV